MKVFEKILRVPKVRSLYIIFLFPVYFFPQKTKEINETIKASKQSLEYFYETGNYEKALTDAQALVKKAKEANNIAGKVQGYYNISYILCGLGMHRQSLEYIFKAENEDYSNPLLNTNLKDIAGRNFLILGWHHKALSYFHKELYWANKIEEPKEKRYRIIVAYAQIANTYAEMNVKDSTWYYLMKQKSMLLDGFYKQKQDISEIRSIHYLYNTLADECLKKKALDSANYYYNIVYNSQKKYNDLTFRTATLVGLGKVEYKKNNFKKAISYYHDAIENTQKIGEYNERKSEIFQLLYEAYRGAHDIVHEKEYLVKYSQATDSISKVQKKEVEHIVNKILNRKDSENDKKELKLTAIIITISLICFILFAWSYYYFKKKKAVEEKIEDTLKVLSEKKKEAELLKQQLNESFDEIIILAKGNSPEFWGRFQEVYPDFRNNMLKINSALKVSELILCAYIYLGFNTKDIAEYTFKAVQTVKNNKNNLRKRLNVPLNENIILWIRNKLQ